jgi:PTS system ascorbate-specific IIA component
MSLVTLAGAVEFGHRENDPVRLVVGLAAPDSDGHVTALATLASFLSDETNRESLLSARSVDEIRALVVEFESRAASRG